MSQGLTPSQQLDKQRDTVRRMNESPCQCLVYHPAPNTVDFENLYKEWIGNDTPISKSQRQNRSALLAQLIANCPYQQK